MKFSCDKYVLQQAAASAARAAAAKSPIPTLEGLLIEAGASVRITGYDLKKAIYTTIDADIPEPGSVLIGARLFCEMLRRMPDGIVTVEAENGTVSVKCGKAAFNLVGLSADDYPDLPVVEAENGVSLPQDLLKKMINECSFAVSTNESRPVYMGTLFEIENNVLTMVSVDGYRLALRREAVEGYGDDCSFIVPGTALSDLERLCGDSDERVVLSVGSKHISFTVGNTVILSRRLEGDFLNYKKAIPESFRVTVKTARTDLLEVVERVSLIIDSKNNAPLRLTFRKDAIDFVCTTPLGKAADSCPCEGDGGIWRSVSTTTTCPTRSRPRPRMRSTSASTPVRARASLSRLTAVITLCIWSCRCACAPGSDPGLKSKKYGKHYN